MPREEDSNIAIAMPVTALRANPASEPAEVDSSA